MSPLLLKTVASKQVNSKQKKKKKDWYTQWNLYRVNKLITILIIM